MIGCVDRVRCFGRVLLVGYDIVIVSVFVRTMHDVLVTIFLHAILAEQVSVHNIVFLVKIEPRSMRATTNPMIIGWVG